MAQRKNKRMAWIATLTALVLLVAAVGVGWFLGSGERGSESPSASQGSSAGPGEAPSEEAGGSVCGLPEGSQAIPAEGPEAEWQILQSHTVPSSDEFGPGETKGGDRACFAHNPTGALFAALNTGRVLPKEHLLKHVTDGPLRDIIEDAPEQSADPETRTNVRGFKLQVVNADKVRVRPVYSTDGGGLYEVPVNMVWREGDWMMDGEDMSEPREVDSLEGYVAWGPQ